MAKFKCNASGTILEVTIEYDINGMRHNPSYTELVEQEPVKVSSVPQVKKAPVKKIKLEEE